MSGTLSASPRQPNTMLAELLTKGATSLGVSKDDAATYQNAKRFVGLLGYTPFGIPQAAYDAGQLIGSGAKDAMAGSLVSGAANIGAGAGLAAFGALPLPDNFVKPLSKYAKKLYRDSGVEGALAIIDPARNRQELGDVFLADHPDLATGQHGNTGIMMTFDPAAVKGRVNTSKPTWQHSWEAGQAEYVSPYARQSELNGALTGFAISPSLKTTPVYKERLRGALGRLEQQGWQKTTLPDGRIQYSPPLIQKQP